jgi:ubiquinol oxidase
VTAASAPHPGFAPHYAPKNFGDRFALGIVKLLRLFADVFFAGRYGNRPSEISGAKPVDRGWPRRNR